MDTLIRQCDLCGVVDDTPRHVFDHGNNLVTTRHFACCANAGCDICSGE